MKGRQVFFFVLLCFTACGKKNPPPAPVVMSNASLKPWSCQILNGVLVVQGEVDRPMDLVLEGRSIRETHHAAFGPVRWEMYRPPRGEVAQLRTAEGKVLARWRFGAAPRMASITSRGPAQGHSPELQIQPSAQLDERLETLRRQLASTMTPAPASNLPSGLQTAPTSASAVLPTPVPGVRPIMAPMMKAEHVPAAIPGIAPVVRAERISPPRGQTLSESSTIGLPADVDRHAWPQPQPLPIPPVPPALGSILPGAPLWAGAGEGFNLVRGPKATLTGQRRMVLSFDGGASDESAEEILDTLKSRNVRTTIFLTGTFIQKFPDLVRRMDREGHDLGNHTMNHPHFAPGMRRDAKWIKERFQEELLSADLALYHVVGHPMAPYWRAPYGEQTKELREWAEEIGFRHVGWSVGADTLDWATSSEKSIYRNGDAVLERLHTRLSKRDADGLIVLMHLGSGRTETDRPSKKLGAFMDRARQEGWQFVKVGDYLQDLQKPAWNPGSRLAMLEQKGPRSGSSAGRATMRR